MDVSLLPLAEVDLKVGDVAIKFEDDDDDDDDDDDKEYIDQRGELGLYEVLDTQEGESNEEQKDLYNNINFHFLSTPISKVESNDSIKRFQCSDCLKYFTRNYHLKNHMRTHTGERPFECSLCQRSFAKHFDLTRHKQFVHKSVTTFFICEECGRTFSRKDHLRSHLITHKVRSLKTSGNGDDSILKTFTCGTCGRTFSCLENLKKHMEAHCESIETGNEIQKRVINDLKDDAVTENVFKGINFQFMSVNDVKTRVDSAFRSFACEFCERLFTRKDHLKNHERTHTGERPFQCEQCDKRFAKRFVMTRHLRNVHRVNTKMHKCTECDRMFTRTDHLKTHMKIHILAAVRNQHKDKLHKCDICDREFTRSDNLKTHMKIHLLAAVKTQQEENSFIEPENYYFENYEDGGEGGGGGGYYFCEVCEDSFPNVKLLEEHEETHRTAATNNGS